METNEQEVTYDEAVEIRDKMEEALLNILKVDDTDVDAEANEFVSSLSEKQRATLQAVFKSEMPTPEEIIRREKCREHNEEVQRKRDERLSRRRQRQKSKHRRR